MDKLLSTETLTLVERNNDRRGTSRCSYDTITNQGLRIGIFCPNYETGEYSYCPSTGVVTSYDENRWNEIGELLRKLNQNG